MTPIAVEPLIQLVIAIVALTMAGALCLCFLITDVD